MNDTQLETKQYVFGSTPWWLIASLMIVVSLYEDSLFGPSLFISIIMISIFHFRNLTPLIAFPTFIGINSEFMHKSFSVGHLSIPWKVPLFLFVVIFCLNAFFRQKRLQGMVVSPYYFAGWLIYLLLVSLKAHTLSLPPYVFVGLLFGLSIASQLFVNENRDNGRFFLILFFFSILFMVIVGYVEVISEKTFLMSQWAQEERYRFGLMRIGSTVADSNYLCSILIPSLFIFNTSPFKKILTPPVVVLINVVITLQIVLTFSRTGLLLFIIGVFLIFILKSKHAKVLLSVSLPVVVLLVFKVIPLLMEVDLNSNSARMYVNKLAFSTFMDSPIFGIGLGSFLNVSEQFTDSVVGALDTMNTYMALLTSGGLINLIFYLGYIWFIYNKSKQLLPYDRKLFLVGFFLYNAFIYTIDSFFIYFTWIFPAVLLALIQHSNANNDVVENCKSAGGA